MVTTTLTEAELKVQERLNRVEKDHPSKDPRVKMNATAAERQRILALMAGLRRRYLNETENIQPQGNEDVLLVLNAKVIAIEQAIEEIEKNS